MRIAFLIKALGAGPGGGAERILATVASALSCRGHDVFVLSFDGPETDDFYGLAESIKRIRLGTGNTQRRSGMIVSAARIVRVRRALAAISPDVAVGFMHSAFIPLTIASLGLHIPVIGSERTAYAHYRNRPLDRILLRISAPLLARLTVNSEQVRSGYPSGIATRMVVIPNPVSSRHALADPIGGKRKLLLSVGGLRPEKDHRTLLRAFAMIAHQFPDWRLRIVGEGPLRGQLSAQVNGLGLDGRVDLAVATKDVDEEYRKAQLFVLPSLYEAFPNCIAEALAHGLPAIGFANCPGTNDLVLPGINGALAEAGTDREGALAKLLSHLMGAPSLRRALGDRAPITVAQFSPNSVTDQWEALLAEFAKAEPTA